MRLQLEVPVYGIPSTDKFAEEEIQYLQVRNEWLRVHYVYYYYDETYDYERVIDIVSIRRVAELPSEVEQLLLVWGIDREYEMRTAPLDAPVRTRILLHVINTIRGRKPLEDMEIDI